jgi:hypothetical protein
MRSGIGKMKFNIGITTTNQLLFRTGIIHNLTEDNYNLLLGYGLLRCNKKYNLFNIK